MRTPQLGSAAVGLGRRVKGLSRQQGDEPKARLEEDGIQESQAEVLWPAAGPRQWPGMLRLWTGGHLRPDGIPENVSFRAQLVGGAVDGIQEHQQIVLLLLRQLCRNRGRRRKP
jgi:hypothetical protein